MILYVDVSLFVRCEVVGGVIDNRDVGMRFNVRDVGVVCDEVVKKVEKEMV